MREVPLYRFTVAFPHGDDTCYIAMCYPYTYADLQRFLAGTQRVIDNLLVRIHFTIVMIRWTGLAPWELEFPFPGSLTATFLIGV